MHCRFSLKPHRVLSLAALAIATVLMYSPSSTQGQQGAPHQEWSFWSNARDNEPPVPPSQGGSRNDDLCLLAPIQSRPDGILDDAMVWSDRPLFLWRGPVSRIEVVTPNDQVIWYATTWESPAPNVYTRLYDGPPLQPGIRYAWKVYQVYNESAPSPTLTIPFQRLSPSDQRQVSAELSAFDVILDAEQVSTDQRPLSYISFFAAQNLWADALRIAFTTEPSSEALQRYRQAVLSTCDRQQP